MPAPPGTSQLVEIGRALLLGGTGFFALALLFGIGAYLVLCARSSRQWDGSEQRWRRPRV